MIQLTYLIYYSPAEINIRVLNNNQMHMMNYKCNSGNVFELITKIPKNICKTDQFISTLHKMPKLLYVHQNISTGNFYFNYIYKNTRYFWQKDNSHIRMSCDFVLNRICELFITL